MSTAWKSQHQKETSTQVKQQFCFTSFQLPMKLYLVELWNSQQRVCNYFDKSKINFQAKTSKRNSIILELLFSLYIAILFCKFLRPQKSSNVNLIFVSPTLSSMMNFKRTTSSRIE